MLVEALAKCDQTCRACARCVDGHRLVELTVPCDSSHPLHMRYAPDRDICPECARTDGHVSAGAWVADMPDDTMRPLLVREEPPSGPERDAITIDLDYRAWHFCRPVDLPNPVDRRGEWAVRLRRVS